EPVLAVILDIDGTLVDSCASDAELYADAIRHVLGQVRIRDAWELYPRVTDTGILADVCRDNCLEYDEGLSLSVMDEFVARLSANMAANGPYPAVPGALRFVQTAVQRPDVRVAYATGGWRASAKLKLLGAGFPLDGIPLASANDHHDRKHIMLHALGQLEGPFTSVTYFGDGVWDREATAALGWEFVPVGPKLGGLMDFSSL
ncbi:MAG TPA: HAD family hydrolase, partial [Steroidobacteraceae bacterium]|nr:HAD family hydrolase [Steroidobacteraceae bacterium]